MISSAYICMYMSAASDTSNRLPLIFASSGHAQ